MVFRFTTFLALLGVLRVSCWDPRFLSPVGFHLTVLYGGLCAAIWSACPKYVLLILMEMSCWLINFLDLLIDD